MVYVAEGMLNWGDPLEKQDQVESQFNEYCFDEHFLVAIFENQQNGKGILSVS